MIDDQKILKYRLGEQEEMRIVQVLGDTTDEELIPRKAYIEPKSGRIYVYVDPDDVEFSDSIKSPIFTKDEDGNVKFRDGANSFIDEQFHKDKISISSFKKMAESIDDRPIYTEEEEVQISGSGKIFNPTIMDGDDFLKKCVKRLFQLKEVDLRILQPDIQEKWTLTNMKSALVRETKMTTTNFVPWMNLLHVGFRMEFFDEDNKIIGNAIPGKMVYDSRTDSIYIETPEVKEEEK